MSENNQRNRRRYPISEADMLKIMAASEDAVIAKLQRRFFIFVGRGIVERLFWIALIALIVNFF